MSEHPDLVLARTRVADLTVALDRAKAVLAFLEETSTTALKVPSTSRVRFDCEVNGVGLRISRKQAAIFEALRSLGPDDYLMPEAVRVAFGGSKTCTQKGIRGLRKHLAAAGVEVVYFEGRGYRMQEMTP